MKMSVSSEVIEILDYLGDKLGIAIDWTNENIIPYLQTLINKFIKWEISTSIVWIVIAVFLIIFCLILMNLKGIREINMEVCDGMLWIPAGIFIFGFFVVICAQAFDIVECNVFPEKVLYDYITGMLSQKG